MARPSRKARLWRFGAGKGLIVLLAVTTVGCSLLDRLKDDVAIQGSYKPPIVPLAVSINSWGEVTIETTPNVTLPTPIGVFSAGLVMESQPIVQEAENLLVIKIDDQQCVYDLHGSTIEINLNDGDFQTLSLYTDQSNNVHIELKGDRYTGCMQQWTTVSAMNLSPTSGASGYEADCPGASPSFLRVGASAYVSVFQAAVLKEPSEFASFAKYRYLDGGRMVRIIDGPVCGPGNPGHVLFWKVQSEVIQFRDGTSGIVEGWIAEESGDVYLLRPVGQRG